MPLPRSFPLALVGLVALLAFASPAQARFRTETPPDTQIAQDGADGRFLMSGTWLQKRDPSDKGTKRKWFRRKPPGSGAEAAPEGVEAA